MEKLSGIRMKIYALVDRKASDNESPKAYHIKLSL